MSLNTLMKLNQRSCSISRKAAFLAGLVLSAQGLVAQSVDREIAILVEGRTSESSDFDLILESVALSFESQEFLSAVAAGPIGSIAASVIFYNAGNSGEQVALDWMNLTTAQELQNFATAIRGLTQPTGGGNVNYATAISTAAASIASSTFTGTESQITLIDDGTGFFAANPAATSQASANALASGVDVINAVVFDTAFASDRIEDYYRTNIVSSPDGIVTVESPQGGPKSELDLSLIGDSIVTAVTSDTIDSSELAAVPEPSQVLLLAIGMLTVVSRRSR